MKVYFTCSTAEFDKHKKTYKAIRNFIIHEGHVLTRDWIPHTERMLVNGKTNIKRDIKDIYIACMKAIDEADAVIIEDTVSNFSTGHQITIALQRRKPTLVLWHGKKHRRFEQMFVHGIESDILEIAEYSDQNLEGEIRGFLAKYHDNKEKNRFHLVLSGAERKYLDWVQYHKKKSRTKVIREALNEKRKKDKKYAAYLRRGN
ncbi:MAG: hypothetical protein PHS44_03380 [Candidatus Dojkabacteria bacterium]|jgi:hypothetical protein|nr:hypothetical protein [Candidatus Dojkabacteria bacterium]